MSVPLVPSPATNTSMSGHWARIPGPGERVAGVLAGHVPGLRDRPVRAERAGRIHDRGAERPDDRPPLRRDVVGHDDRERVAPTTGHEREGDGGVAGARFEEGLSRPEL